MIVLVPGFIFTAMAVILVVAMRMAATTVRMTVAVPMMIVMRRSRIKTMRQRSSLRRLLLPGGGIPTITFKMHLRNGHKFF